MELRAAKVRTGMKGEVRPFFDRKTPLLLELPQGSLLEVVREEVPWTEVRVPGGLEVWVHGDYVNWKDDLVFAKTSRLRARPLPSTSGNSHPVGKLSTEWGMPVLARKDAWLKVLAPEELSAWVLTEQIEILEQKPAAWGLSWSTAAKKRRTAVLATATEVEQEESNADATEKPVAESADESAEVGSSKPDSSAPVTEQAAESAAAAAATAKPVEAAARKSAVLNRLVGLEALRKDPALAVATARKNLDAHAQEVTAEVDLFAAPVLENCEMIFTAVLFQSEDPILVADARQGLTRSDAVRKFHASAMAARARRLEVEQGLAAGTLHKPKKAAPEGGEGEGRWVGRVLYKPHQYPETPFVAVRSDREVLIHSFDGRYYLKDYVGREIVVQGKWRATGQNGEHKVIAVEKIRVLPRNAGVQ